MTVRRARLRKESARFLKFSAVGVIGAVVDFGTFNLLTRALRFDSILASMISFTAAVTSNFLWNRFWTYPDSRSKPIGRQAAEFALVNLIGLAIRTPIFAVARAPATRLAGQAVKLPLPAPLQPLLSAIPERTLGLNLALALSVLVVLIWNFGVNRVWTYSDVD